jgi:ABC-type branched-subunit amino acid transport system substrate-binding protein
MKPFKPLLASAWALSALLHLDCALAQKQYGPGVTDTEIKIGQTMSYSGPLSATGTIGRAHAAYFRMLNERGGINGRRINLVSLDDGYNPAKTVEQTRKLVEQDEVLLMFGSVGTGPQTGVQKYLNARKVPQLFITAATLKLVDPKRFPWTMPFYPNQRIEVAPLVQHLLSTRPAARIGVLYQNDDYGKGFVEALREALGDKAQSLIVAEASYLVSDPTVDSQIIALRSAGADTLFNFSTPKFGAFAIRKVYDLRWQPVHFITGPSTSVGATLVPAGLEKSVGLLSARFLKDPTAAEWQNDAATKEWLAWMKRYYPDGDVTDWMNVYAYTSAQALAYVLERCGGNLTRENVMREASNIEKLELPMLLPGVHVNTSPTEYYPIRQTLLRRFDGKAWVRLDGATATRASSAGVPPASR